MKKLFLCLFFAAISIAGKSQRLYFVYLQAEPEQAFFVKMNDKLHSSSPSGYLILSKLRDSVYQFSVGFPQNKWPEQKFTVTVNGKDLGFLLKNFGEKGWGLYNLQTLAVQMAAADTRPAGPAAEKAEVSAFTDILAKAADDSTLLNKPAPVKKEEKITPAETVTAAKEEAKQEVKTEIAKQEKDKSKEIIDTPEVKKPTEEKPVPVVKEEFPKTAEAEYKRSTVIRRSESSTTEGFGLTFIDEFSNGAKDTIRILIPNPPLVAQVVKEEPKQEKKFLDITTETPKQTTEPAKPVITETKQEQPPVETPLKKEVVKPEQNSKCKDAADENDFLKLRRTMASGESDDDMLDEAKKYFKAKCFSTAQIKNLSVLFLNDEGKYKFFDLSYSYVTDENNYTSLETELKEDYYKNRFRAMLRN